MALSLFKTPADMAWRVRYTYISGQHQGATGRVTFTSRRKAERWARQQVRIVAAYESAELMTSIAKVRLLPYR